MVSTMRNEGPFLLEWLAHHMGAGFTDFLIYSNDCDDGCDAMLDALHAAGVLTHVRHARAAGQSIQWQALRAAWKHPLRKAADWILVADADEFLNIHVPGHSLNDLLSAMPAGSDAITLPWRLFGHNDAVFLEDRPVREQFTAAIPGNCTFPLQATFFKTLFRRRGAFNQLGVHRPRQRPEDKAGLPLFVDGSGAPLPEEFARTVQKVTLWGFGTGRALAEINHYAIRSAASFILKRDRGLPNRAMRSVDLDYWVARNFNTAEENSIHAMVPASAPHLEALRAIPGVADLHDGAVAWHHERFDVLMQDDETQHLFARCVTAGGSKVLPRRLQDQLISWRMTINERDQSTP